MISTLFDLLISFFYVHFEISQILNTRRREKRLHEYFENALRAWLLRNDDAARAAAITTVKISPGPLHKSLVEYFSALSDEIRNKSNPTANTTCARLGALASELPKARFWTRNERRRALQDLASLDKEYATALARAKPDVFESRYPELFT